MSVENDTGNRRDGKPASGWEWRPVASQGGGMSIAASAAGAVVALLGMAYLFTRPLGIDSFLVCLVGLAGLVVALVAGGLAYGYRNLRYRLTEEEFSIDLLWRREVVPLAGMEGLFRGQRLGTLVGVRGISWPGFDAGTLESPEFGTVTTVGTTRDLSQALLLVAGDRGYLVTPADLEGFRSRLLERLEALPEEPPADMPLPRTEPAWWLDLPVLRDRVSMGLLGAAFLVVVITLGYLSLVMPGLPPQLAIRYGASGVPGLTMPSGDLVRLPLMGFLLLLANGVVAAAAHRWNRDAGRVVAGATLFLQLAILAATVQLAG